MIDYTIMKQYEVVEYYLGGSDWGSKPCGPYYAFRHIPSGCTRSPFFSKRECLAELKRFIRCTIKRYGEFIP